VYRPRTLLAALAVLALSAGVVLGADPPPPADGGLATAGQASGLTLPSSGRPELDVPAPTPTDEDENEPAESPKPAENGEHPDNHGAVVSQAAQGETPDGWANHGAYVSAVARGLVEPGAAAPAEAVANGGRLKPTKPTHPATGKPDGAGRP
jgi:hypothetical protein